MSVATWQYFGGDAKARKKGEREREEKRERETWFETENVQVCCNEFQHGLLLVKCSEVFWLVRCSGSGFDVCITHTHTGSGGSSVVRAPDS